MLVATVSFTQAFHQTGCLQLLFFDDLGNGLGFVGGDGGSVKLGQWTVGHGGCDGGHGYSGYGLR